MSIETLVQFSNHYGADSRFVLAGGGNTSMKTEEYLYIKGSGTSLATITEEGFVKMDRSSLAAIWNKQYPENSDEREAAVLRMRYGMHDGRNHTLEEVGKIFNVTRERIRQIEAKALRKLRHPSRSKKLKDFLD